MLLRSTIALLACLAFATVGWAAPVTEPPQELKDAMPIGGALPLGERVWHARIEVPEDAMRLAVMVSADRDIDVFLTHEAPPTGDGSTEAGASSFSPAPHEVVAVSTTTEPRLEAGTWYVSVQNPFPQSTAVEFEVVAFVDRRDVERTMLAGDGATLRFSTPARPTVFRTYLPQRALQAVLDLDPAPPGGFLYTVRGPQEFVRRGRSRQGQLVFDATEAPPGGYLVTLVPAVRVSRPVASAARLSVSFEGGTTLPLPPNPILRPDDPVPVLLGGTARSSIQRFRIEVPEDTRGFVLEAANARGADVDIFVRRGTPTRIEDEDAQWLGISTSPLERVVVAGEEPLRRGTYHAEVVLLENDRPVEVVVTLRQLDADDDVCTWGHELPAALEPDVWTQSAVKVDRSGVRWHAIRVPQGSRSLHLQLLDASGPLELLVARPADGSVLARSFSSLVDEHLGVSFPAPLTADRVLLAGVLNRATWDPDVRYRIAAGIDRRPTLPKDLVWPPVHDLEDLTVPERIAAATVEITIGDCSGGSGICVSPDGLIVSCRHCLQLADGTGRVQRDRILVAFSPTFDAPPTQTFFAEIVAEDPQRDLVLLKPLRDVFGRDMDPAWVFPWIPLGNGKAVRVGDELWVAGYPQMGSECVRTAVILSHGIVSGLERRPTGSAWIKTDAWVAAGHSGGPVVDRQGKLVAVAAATLGRTESLGLCVPVDRIPKAWREQIAEAIQPATAD